jgi:large subunit ribosomal protein L9
MKVLLLKDVYKLGRAGDVKKVANGYGRNYLIPQGLAVLATPGALKQAERIRATADARRVVLNQEMGGVAEKLIGQVLTFAVRASETGRLFGSVTTRMVADMINEKLGVEISHRQVELEPIRILGKYIAPIRLTIDLAPELSVIVHREGAAPDFSDEEGEEIIEEEIEEIFVAELEEVVEAISEEDIVDEEVAEEILAVEAELETEAEETVEEETSDDTE